MSGLFCVFDCFPLRLGVRASRGPDRGGWAALPSPEALGWLGVKVLTQSTLYGVPMVSLRQIDFDFVGEH